MHHARGTNIPFERKIRGPFQLDLTQGSRAAPKEHCGHQCSLPEYPTTQSLSHLHPAWSPMTRKMATSFLQLSALGNNHIQVRHILAAVTRLGVLHLLDDVHTVHHLAKDDVLAVQEGGGNGCDEEL